MTTIGIVIAAAAVALAIARASRLPGSVLAILAGVALRAMAAPVDAELIEDGLLLAATFLVFSVGAEIDRRSLRGFRGAALTLAALHALVTVPVAALVWWWWLGQDHWTLVYLVLALSGSSTLLALEVLRRRERFFEPLGRAVTAASLMQDLLVILGLAVVSSAADGTPSLLRGLGGTLAIGLGAWMCARWVAPFVMLRMRLQEEERLLFVLVILFGFSGIAAWSGVPLVTGAYFAGMALSRFPVGGVTRGYLTSFSDFFTVLFFVMLGLFIAVPGVPTLLAEAALLATILVVRPFVLLPVLRRMGLTVRSSLEAVALLGQVGELALIVALVGVEMGQMGEGTLGLVVMVVVVSMALAPLLSSDPAAGRLTRWYPFSRRIQRAGRPPEGRTLLVGCGETGTALLQRLGAAATDVVVVDADPAIVKELRRRGVAAVRGDGGDTLVLEHAGLIHATAVVSTMRRLADNARLLQAARDRPVFVRVFSDTEAQQIRALGGQPVQEAEIATSAFLHWYEQWRRADAERRRPGGQPAPEGPAS